MARTKLSRLPDLLRVGKSFEYIWGSILALELTLRNGQRAVRPEEFFAGLYLVARDYLVGYWQSAAQLDGFVRQVCGLDRPIWLYWIEYHETAVREGTEAHKGAVYSRSLARVLSRAARLALRRGEGHGGTSKVGLDDVLEALLEQRRLRFTRQLIASGLRGPQSGGTPLRRLRVGRR